MSNRLLIIQPSHYHSKRNRTVFKSRPGPWCRWRCLIWRRLPRRTGRSRCWTSRSRHPLGFASGPGGHHQLDGHSIRGYDVARRFRERGIPVIMGGPHVWFHHEEAADMATPSSSARPSRVLGANASDAAGGRLEKGVPRSAIAHHCRFAGAALGLARPPEIWSVQRASLSMSSRGCPMQCEFCSERLYWAAASASGRWKTSLRRSDAAGRKHFLWRQRFWR